MVVVVILAFCFSACFGCEVDGFPVRLGAGAEPLWGAPAVASLESTLIIIVGSTNDSIYAVRTDGSFAPGFPLHLPGPVASKVAWEPTADGLAIFALTTDGTLCRIDWNGTYAELVLSADLGENSGRTSPVLFDVDDDGEINVIAAVDTSVFCLSPAGELIWRGEFWSSVGCAVATPAAGDIDGDGENEVVVEGYEALFALNSDGTNAEGFPVELSGAAFSYSAPFLWDCDGDEAAEIFCGAHQTEGCNYGIVYKVDVSEGAAASELYTVPGYGSWVYSTASWGDLNGDYAADLAFGSVEGTVFGLTCDGALSSFGGVALHLSLGHIYGSTILCDVDSQPGPEYIIQSFDEDGGKMYLIVMDPTASYIDGFPDSVDAAESGVLTPAVFTYGGSTYVAACDARGNLHLWAFAGCPLPGYDNWLELFGDRRNRNTAPPQPTALSVTRLDDTTYQVCWRRCDNADFLEYRVYVSSDSAGTAPAVVFSSPEPAETCFSWISDAAPESLWFFAVVRDSFGRGSLRSVPVSPVDTALVGEAKTHRSVVIHASPNPFNSFCDVLASGAKSVKVFTITGRCVFVAPPKTRLSAERLPAGMLLLKAFDARGAQLATKRIFVVK